LASLLLLAIGAGAHIWYFVAACPLDLSGDEAYYWAWSRHLDWSYADTNGPLTAYIIAGSRALLGDWSSRVMGTEILAVRLPAVALSVLTGWGVYTLAMNVLRRPRVAFLAVALTFTIPILAVGAGLMTIDAPLACAWVWALISVHRALARDTVMPWLVTGLLVALGILTKYNMGLLFLVVGLLLLREPGLRNHLRRPGPYLATVIGLSGMAPILIWNAHHDWLSFRQVTQQAGLSSGLHADLMGPLAYAGGQMAVMGLVWAVGMVAGTIALWRRPVAAPDERHEAWAIRLLVLATAAPWLVFLGFSPITKIQPNWPAVALLAGTPVMAAWLARRWRIPAQRRRVGAFIAAGVVLGGCEVLAAHRSEWLTPVFVWLARGAPPLGLTPPAPPWELTPVAHYDPAARLRGWAELGTAVGAALRDERTAGREPFILAGDYGAASEIAFYCPGNPEVYSAQSVVGNRRSQYDVWPNPIRQRAEFVGRPCLYVGSLHRVLTGDSTGAHAALPGLRLVRTVEHQVGGQVVQIWSIYACDAFAGFDAPAGGGVD